MTHIVNYLKSNTLISIANLLIGLIFIVPYCYDYYGEYEYSQLEWHPTYIYNDVDLLSIYISMVILLITFQIIKPVILKNITLIILIIINACCTSISLLSAVLPVQDYLPSLGQLLLPIFTLVLLLVLIKRLRQ